MTDNEKTALDITQIAKMVRADIKRAQLAGWLPAKMKVSVRARRFAGGQALDVVISNLPFMLQKASWLADAAAGRISYEYNRYTVGAAYAREAVESVVAQYNYDHSDTQSDYFDVNFYGHVKLDDEELAAEMQFARDLSLTTSPIS